MTAQALHYSAFTDTPGGGNPAGVVLDARTLSTAQMQAMAAAIGYSETAFLLPRPDGAFDIRYYSPLAEVSFCGHATIAAAVAHARQHGAGNLHLHTRAGLVQVQVDRQFNATLTSVAPRVEALAPEDLHQILTILDWQQQELDPTLPAALAYAGAWHPVLAVTTRARLARLQYAFDPLATLMAQRRWTTVNLIYRENPRTFHARNPFPPGGVIEDPATGAAAAALGAYLATRDALPAQRRFQILQGDDMGRPSRLTVTVPDEPRNGIQVSGTAVRIDAD